jgi:ABC-2 type transport system permease protein
MRKVLAVVRREFVTRVRARAFLIGTVAGPLVMGIMVAMPALLDERETAPKHIVVLDAASDNFGLRAAERLTSEMRDTAARAIPRYRVDRIDARGFGRLAQVQDSLVRLTGLRKASADAVDGILLLADSALEAGRIHYLGVNVGSPSDMQALSDAVQPVLVRERLVRSGVDPRIALAAMRAPELTTEKVSDGRRTGESGRASFILAYAMSFILYLALLLYGVQIMSSVVEEKTSRIVEVLVSSMEPFDLLLGKVLGVGAVALLQISIWSGTAMALTTFRGPVARLLGASPATLATLPIPTVSPAMLAVFLVFFVLGFLFYSAAYAAVGSLCNSPQEAQQAQIPITLCIAAGLFCMFALLSEPAGRLAQVLSLVPFVAPFVTPVRYSFAPLPWSDLLLSAGMMIVGVLVVTWVAARIYRVGILMYGKKPSLAEVARWVRTS